MDGTEVLALFLNRCKKSLQVFSHPVPMALILDGSSEHIAQVWTETDNFMRLRHVFTSTAVLKFNFFEEEKKQYSVTIA